MKYVELDKTLLAVSYVDIKVNYGEKAIHKYVLVIVTPDGTEYQLCSTKSDEKVNVEIAFAQIARNDLTTLYDFKVISRCRF